MVVLLKVKYSSACYLIDLLIVGSDGILRRCQRLCSWKFAISSGGLSLLSISSVCRCQPPSIYRAFREANFVRKDFSCLSSNPGRALTSKAHDETQDNNYAHQIVVLRRGSDGGFLYSGCLGAQRQSRESTSSINEIKRLRSLQTVRQLGCL
jgi:hypothetical protein